MTVPEIRMRAGWRRVSVEAYLDGLFFRVTLRRGTVVASGMDLASCQFVEAGHGEVRHSLPAMDLKAPARMGIAVDHQRNLLDVIRALSLPGQGRPEALQALASLLPPGTVPFALGCPSTFLKQTARYLGESRTCGAMRALATAHPSIAPVLNLVVDKLKLEGRRDLPDAGTLLARYMPEASPGSIRRVLGHGSPVTAGVILDAMLAVPHDWIPDDATGRAAFGRMADAAYLLAAAQGLTGTWAPEGRPARGYRDALGSAKGRWAEFEARVATTLARNPHGGTEARHACRGAADAAHAFARQVLVPALAARGVLDERSLLNLGHCHPEPGCYGVGAHMVAARLLFGGKSMPAIFETSARWHARQAAIDASMAGLPHGEGALTSDRWPVPFGPLAAPNGVEIRFLGTTAELVAEGSHGRADGATGLGHCVGGYSGRCRSGETSVASLRVPGPYGSFERLSTAAVSLRHGRVSVGEHAGHRNGMPQEAAREALAWFVGEVRAGRLEPSYAFAHARWSQVEEPRTVMEACGYAWHEPGAVEAALADWAPLLARPLRDVDALVAAALPHLPGEPFDTDPDRMPTWRRLMPLWLPAVVVSAIVALGFLTPEGTGEASFSFLGRAILVAVPPALSWLALVAYAGAEPLAAAIQALLAAAALLGMPWAVPYAGIPLGSEWVMAFQAVLILAPHFLFPDGKGRGAVVTGSLWLRATAFNLRRRLVEAMARPSTREAREPAGAR